MTPAALVTLGVVALFTLVFLGAFRRWLRDRDPISRDVALMFSPFLGLLIAAVWQPVLGKPPALLSLVFGLLFVAQPLFALHLASLVRPVPRVVMIGAAAVIALTIAPALVLRPLPTVLSALLLGVFVSIEGLTAVYLLLEARRRSGPSAARLATAAAATGLFAAALLVATLGLVGRELADGSSLVVLGLALLAGIGYVVAFLPPGPIQRIWQAGAIVDYQHALFARSAEPVDDIWRGYLEFAARVTGSECVVVLTGSDGQIAIRVAQGSSISEDALARATGLSGPALAIADVATSALPADGLAARLASLTAARFVSVVPLDTADDSGRVALVVLSSHRSLFQASDLDLLATIGAQTGTAAERRAVLADQEALSRRLSKTVDALAAASQAKSDFLASMSHELRTPLSAILGFSDLMRGEAVDGTSVRVPLEWVEHIHRGGQHLLSLINDVLDLSRIEAGRLDLQLESLDLRTAVAEVLNGLKPLADRKRLRIDSAIPPTVVLADRGRLRQILYNLVSNAIKFTLDGGCVSVEASPHLATVRISVIDDGVGIAAEDQELVFEEFRQVGTRDIRAAGSGLGLPLSRRLAEAQGGRLEVESAPGAGSRFTVTLPLSTDPIGAPGIEPSASALGTAATTDGSREILVIEDDPSALRLLREYLEGAGYRLRTAADGTEGLRMARERHPDAIILDVLLPGLDGWEVLRQLKADSTSCDVPVVMVTVVDERELGIALGAVDYLVKPIAREVLLHALARLIPLATRRTGPVRVLAVDDERAALDLIAAALSGDGFEIAQAHGGREGIASARSSIPDIVICDLVMPDVDGFAVVAALKADTATADIPIVICTAHDLSADEKERLHGDILGIVTKGTDAREGLRGWLAQAMASARVLE